jgi:hypothetical protein
MKASGCLRKAALSGFWEVFICFDTQEDAVVLRVLGTSCVSPVRLRRSSASIIARIWTSDLPSFTCFPLGAKQSNLCNWKTTMQILVMLLSTVGI